MNEQAQTLTDIANLALALIGETRIDSLDDDGAVALDCATVIHSAVREVQADFPWPELRKAAVLELDGQDEVTGLWGFYLPDDFLRMARSPGEFGPVTDELGAEVDYERIGPTLYCAAESARLHYIAADCDPAGWSPWLCKAIYTMLAINLAPLRNKSKTLTEQLIQIYENIVRPRARRAASLYRTSQRARRSGPSRYDRAGRGY